MYAAALDHVEFPPSRPEPRRSVWEMSRFADGGFDGNRSHLHAISHLLRAVRCMDATEVSSPTARRAVVNVGGQSYCTERAKLKKKKALQR